MTLGLKASIAFFHEAKESNGVGGFGLSEPQAIYIDKKKHQLLIIKNSNFYQAATLIPQQTPLQYLGDDKTAIDVVKARLFNFIEFGGGNGATGYDLILKSNNLSIAISALPSTARAFENLKSGSAYEHTHYIEITRQDGMDMSGAEACQVLTTLNRFLTLVKGGWCQAVLPEGYSDKQRVWRMLNAPREAYRNPISWFPIHQAKLLQPLFDNFFTNQRCSKQAELWSTLVYWYQNANTNERGIDSGIIIAQTAIERLSYAVIVEEAGMLSERGFESLRASDKFRLLLSFYKIDLCIPESLSVLQSNMVHCNWTDGAHAVTAIRNSLVHPKTKHAKAVNDSMYDAWRLSLWYLEVCFLKYFNYEGVYSNRLTAKWLGETDEL
jgi:hypothetical protein